MRGPRIWFDPPFFRWPRVLVVAALAVAAVIGWLAHERGLWREAATPAPPAPLPASAPAPRAVASSVPARMAATATPSVVAAVPPTAATLPARAPGPHEIEVCGLGIVKAKEGGPNEIDALLDKSRSSAAFGAWRAALLSSADVRARAAALRLAAAARPEETQPVSALAQIAHDSREPMVYALAMGACHQRSPPPGACQLLSNEQWVTVDPDNAVPWLNLASAARSDPTEALHRAARATFMKSYWGSVFPLVMAAQPAGTPPLARLAMSMDALSLSAGMPLPPYPTKFCDAAAVRDVNRRQQCDALAELFASRGETLVDLAMGRALGERVGWPAERLKALLDERDALPAVQQAQLDIADPFSCAGIERRAEYFGEVARRGELGAMREALRRSGRSVEEVAAQARRERAAAAAASPASAPGR